MRPMCGRQDLAPADRGLRAAGPIYGWFTKGFDTADVHEAKALLEELGDNVNAHPLLIRFAQNCRRGLHNRSDRQRAGRRTVPATCRPCCNFALRASYNTTYLVTGTGDILASATAILYGLTIAMEDKRVTPGEVAR